VSDTASRHLYPFLTATDASISSLWRGLPVEHHWDGCHFPQASSCWYFASDAAYLLDLLRAKHQGMVDAGIIEIAAYETLTQGCHLSGVPDFHLDGFGGKWHWRLFNLSRLTPCPPCQINGFVLVSTAPASSRHPPRWIGAKRAATE